METLLKILKINPYTEAEVRILQPSVLAYVGDAVYEKYIRLWSAYMEKGAIVKHHRRTVLRVKAEAQVKMLRAIEPELTELELDIVRKGRNVKTGSVPKNASVGEYRLATGFEALVGYLYLAKQHERIETLIAVGIMRTEAKEQESLK